MAKSEGGESGVRSAFKESMQVLVWLGGRESAPRDEEWKAYTEWAVHLGTRLKTQGRPLRVLVITDACSPNSVQRSAFVEATRGLQIRTAVLSSNTFVRGVASVFTWFDVNNKVFAPKAAAEAFNFLEIEPDLRAAVWSAAERVALDVTGGVATVAAASEVLRSQRRSGAA